MHKHYAVIFDLDGVLVDTVGSNWQANNQLLAHYGVRIADEELHDFIGRALQDQIAIINQRFSLSLNWQAFQATTNPIKARLLANLKPTVGAIRLLQSLKAGGVKLAVGTSSPKQVADDRLRTAGLIDFFPVIVSADDVPAHKPAPDVYLEAARQLRAAPEDCVVIEDAPSGIAAARNAGMHCVAMRSRYTTDAELAGADRIVDSLAALDAGDLLIMNHGIPDNNRRPRTDADAAESRLCQQSA